MGSCGQRVRDCTVDFATTVTNADRGVLAAVQSNRIAQVGIEIAALATGAKQFPTESCIHQTANQTMNIELEAQFDELANICCEAIDAEGKLDEERVRALIESIVRCGFDQKERKPVSIEVEKRIKAKCREPSMHRGAEIQSLSEKIQAIYDDVARWQSQQPDDPSTPPKAANISSATRA